MQYRVGKEHRKRSKNGQGWRMGGTTRRFHCYSNLFLHLWLCGARECSMINTIVKPLFGLKCFASQTSSHACRVSLAIASVERALALFLSRKLCYSCQRARLRVHSEYGCVFCAGSHVESCIPVISLELFQQPSVVKAVQVTLGRTEWEMTSWVFGLRRFPLFSIGFHRCFERVLGRPAGSGLSWEGLRGQARLVLYELGSVAFWVQ